VRVQHHRHALSRKEFETFTSVRVAKWASNVIAALAERIKGGGEIPANEKDLCAQIDMARQDVAPAPRSFNWLVDAQ
jgi:hypothetical protein